MSRPSSKKKSAYDSKWQRRRKAHIKENPLCWACGKTWKKGFNVHHIDGIGLDPDHTKLATLCPSCHDIVESIVSRAGNLKRKHLDQIWRLAQWKLTAIKNSKKR